MARKTKTKHYPVVRRGKLFRQSPDPIGPNIEIDIAKNLSKVNRRLYRQGRIYDCKVELDANIENAGQIHVYALADNWMNSRAFKMAYAMYLENTEAERARLKEANLARWEDFRVRSGADITVVDPVQYDEAFTPVVLTQGEFAISIVVDAAGTQKSFTWGGPTASRYSILEEYDLAGDTQASPPTSTGDAPYSDLMADDHAALGGLLQTSGNFPPYDNTGVIAGSPWVRVATLSTGTSQKLSTGFFKAPCGLVILDTSGAVTNVNVNGLTWEVKGGDYKGVSASSMLE